MKSSSFLGGVLVGAFAAIWASRRKQGIMSAMNGAGTALKFAGLTSTRHEGKDGDISEALKTEHTSSSAAAKATGADAQVYPSPVSQTHSNHSKEYNLKQLTDFIKGNADVRREVEAILKETNTAIPGL
ncbi:hypothetical protein [Paenibacillus macerans]|uniref:hypothetical protein n=1 Tax=Paenibacillus macerans TaxID=44252 RepID=UPI003D310EF2